MRLSRSCYDKWHRCPGWAGGGWHYPKGPDRCEGGYLQIDWEARFVRWRFWKCNKCDVVIWPWHTRWLDPTWVMWWVPTQIKDLWEDPRFYFYNKYFLAKFGLQRMFRRKVSE